MGHRTKKTRLAFRGTWMLAWISWRSFMFGQPNDTALVFCWVNTSEPHISLSQTLSCINPPCRRWPTKRLLDCHEGASLVGGREM